METELELEVMKLMCVSAAGDIQMQCREYGFANGGEYAHASALHSQLHLN